ncbi:DUF4174 domain-containing protein [Aquimarina rubra]|uniref:DUF4174 domain-containing protein n=1 Tax=Aquimarina rubra TaxID=1920033 RepID=A0ABW5LLX2_9FLAO
MKTLLFLLTILPFLSFSQNINKHQWKDRLLLVISDSYQNSKFIKQLQEFEKHKELLKERKLIIYQITPSSYREGLGKNESTKSNSFYKKHNSSKKDFKIILIGLDGGIKMESFDFVSANKIFNQIDQMPMRIQELKTKNK